MPKKLSLASVTLDGTGALYVTFGLDIVEGEELIHRAPHLMNVPPNGDLDMFLDATEEQTSAKGYLSLTPEMRQLITDIDANARGNEAIESNRAQWIEDNPPIPVIEPTKALEEN